MSCKGKTMTMDKLVKPGNGKLNWKHVIKKLTEQRCNYDVLLNDEWRHKVVPRDDVHHFMHQKEMHITGSEFMQLQSFLKANKEISINAIAMLAFHLVLEAYGYGDVTIVAALLDHDSTDLSKVLPLIVDHSADSELTSIETLREMDLMLKNNDMFVEGANLLNQGLFDAAFLLSGDASVLPDHFCCAPLTSAVSESPGDKILTWKLFYASNLFENKIAIGILSVIHEVLIQLAQPANHSVELKYLPLISDSQKAQLMEWNKTDADFPAEILLHQLVEMAATRTPDGDAIIFKDICMTYKEVEETSDLLTSWLRTRGIRETDLIGLYMDKSHLVVLTMLAIWKAGAAFLPIDPLYPTDRVQYMLSDSKSRWIVSNEHHADKLKDILNGFKTNVQIIPVESALESAKSSQAKKINQLPELYSSSLAYVTYTSGTTGIPKGVPKYHNTVVNSITDLSVRYNMLEPRTERVALFAAYVFEPFIRQMLIALTNSQTLAVLPDDVRNDPEKFPAFLKNQHITYLNATGSVLYHFDISNLPDLKRLLLVGEELNAAGLKQIRKWFNGQIIIEYGLTESAFVTAIKTFSPGENDRTDRSIGRPLRNVKCYVLSESLKQLPPGAIGELYIGGMGVASGYLNRPDLTKDRFLKNPFQTNEEKQLNRNEQIYKTGDLARLLPNGEFEYMGRSDFQLKLSGVRVEPGEIEAVTMKFPGVKKCVVVSRKRNFSADQQHLVGYFTVDSGLENIVTEVVLIDYLNEHLISAMVPARMICLDKIPTNINGKVDRCSLPKIPELLRHPTPENSTKVNNYRNIGSLRKIWSEVLGVCPENVSAKDDFFRSGGQSITCVLLIAEIRKHLHKNLNIEDVFTLRTLGNIAAHLAMQKIQQDEADSISSVRTRFATESKLEKETVLPANGLQQGLLYQSLKAKEFDDAYIMQSVYSYKCYIYTDALKKAWELIIRKYPGLRLRFEWRDHPLQIIQKSVSLQWFFQDLTELKCDKEQDMKIEDLQKQDRKTPFKIEQGPLFRVHLIKKNDDDFILLFTCHHIILDGWSLSVLHDDVHNIYLALLNNRKVNLRVDEAYVSAQKYWIEHQKNNIGYWQGQISQIGDRCDFTGLLRTEMKYKTELFNYDQISEHKEKRLIFTAEETSKAKLVCVDNNFTLHSALQFAWHKVLHIIGGGTFTVVGTIVSGRTIPIAGIERSIGLFINTIPIIVNHEIQKNQTIADAITIIQANVNSAQSQHIIDLGSLVIETRKHGLFDTLLVLENYPKLLIDDNGLKMPNDVLSFKHEYDVDNIDYPLALLATEEHGKLVIKLWYAGELFDDKMIDIVLETMYVIFSQLVRGPLKQVSELKFCSGPMLAEFETWNRTEIAFNTQATIHGVFKEVSTKWPESIAVVFEETQVTYSQLDKQANQLAHFLKKKDPHPHSNDLVALVLNKNEKIIVAILAVWKSGAAYVPIDANLPDERVKFMLEDTQSRLVLTNTIHKQRIGNLCKNSKTVLDIDTASFDTEPNTDPVVSVKSTDLAYAIYTSGTTGKPKAVLVEHRGVVNLQASLANLFSLKRERGQEGILSFSNYIFDHFVEQMTDALLNGQKLIILNDDMRGDQTRLFGYMRKNQVTYLSGTPSVLSLYDFSSAPFLSRIHAGGEDLTTAVFEKIRSTFKGLIINGYGPTEVSITTHKRLYFGDELRLNRSIGFPVANVKAYVLNEFMKQLPIGAIGELYLGGVGVARGYLNNEKLTAERFTLNPFQTDAEKYNGATQKIYRTGDLARWLPNGEIEYLGRTDQQVKIRGHRIELGEIESVLTSYPGISRSIIVIREQKLAKCNASNMPEKKYIVGFYLADCDIEEQAIQKWMKSKLSSALVPARILRIKDIPITNSGKLDLQRLPETSFSGSADGSHFPPENETEVKLCEIWCKILNIPIESISVLDDFFNLGGDSINAISLVQCAKHTFNSQFAVSAVFDNVTVRTQAKYIERLHHGQIKNKTINADNPSVDTSFGELHPVSMGQQRILFIDEYEGGSCAYNIQICIKTNLDKNAIENALRILIHRHESLRVIMAKTIDGEWAQKILNNDTAQSLFQLGDINVHSSNEVDAVLSKEAEHVFKLTKDLPIHFALLETTATGSATTLNNENSKYVSLVFHHTCFDGWSWNILREELHTLLTFPNGYLYLDRPTARYTDFVKLQKQLLRWPGKTDELKQFWMTYLSGAEPATLPEDFPRPPKFDYQGREFQFEIDERLTAKLEALATTCQVSLYSLLLAGFSLMIETYTMQKNFILGTPYANRENSEFRNVIGFFAILLPLRMKVDTSVTIKTFIRSISKALRQAMGHSEMPYEDLLHCMDVPIDPSRNPLIQIVFTLLKENNSDGGKIERDVTEIFQEYKPNSNSRTKTKFDITVVLMKKNSRITGTFTYASSIYVDDSALQFSRTFLNILEEFVRLTSEKDTKLAYVFRHIQFEAKALQQNKSMTQSTNFSEPVHLVFERFVAQQPRAIAVLFDNQQISYSELDKRANRLRDVIFGAISLCPNDLVVLILDKSNVMIEAILAVWKSGAAYVPIDPNYPGDRIEFMLADTKTKLILTSSQHASKIQKMVQQFQIILQIDMIPSKPQISCVKNVSANDLAYAIYTSGTTGKPKLVLVEHTNLHRFLTAAGSVLQRNKKETVLFLSNYVFDFSLEQIVLSILSGNRLLIPNANLTPFDEDYYSMLNQAGLTYLSGTPTQVTQINLSLITTLQTVLVAGEHFQKHHFEKIKDWFSGRLFSAYGTTETTVYNTVECFSGNKKYKNAIGYPLQNSQIYVLNDRFVKVPYGAIGELYLSGECVSQGYYNRPDLTSEKFFAAHEVRCLSEQDQHITLYRTGDLVRLKSEDTIEYMGRTDTQLKINGLRIEPAEIEAVLYAFGGVKQCSILKNEQEPATTNRLVGYIQMEKGYAFNEQKMLSFLRQKLPSSILPAHIIQIENSFPMTVNGKLDLRALRGLKVTRSHVTYSAPRNRLDAALCRLWEETTGNSNIGIDDDFFHNGGDSIKAMMLASMIKRELKKDISVKHVFDFPTVHQFSDELTNLDKSSKQNCTYDETNATRSSGPFPLLPIQRWFFSLPLQNRNYWNQTFALRTPKLDPEKLKKAVEELIRYHDAFHLRFRINETYKQFEQFYSTEPEEFRCHIIDVNGKSEREIQSQLDEWQDSFDLKQGPLWCFAYLHGYSNENAKLWFAIHQLVVDTVSWHILGRDLEIIYNGGALGKQAFNFSQWAEILEDYKPDLSEDQMWNNIKNELNQTLSNSDLFTEYCNETHHERFKLSNEETKFFLSTSQKMYDTHVNDLLLTALGLALKKITNCAANFVTLESHGRPFLEDGPELRNTVGWFTTMYPFKMEIREKLAESILCVKSMRKQIPNQGIGYGLRCGPYCTNEAPLPQVTFNYLGVISQDLGQHVQNLSWHLDATMCELRNKESNASSSPFVVNITMYCDQGQLNAVINSRWRNPEKTRILSVELENSLRTVISHTSGSEFYSSSRKALCPNRENEVLSEATNRSVEKPLENFEPYILIEARNKQAGKNLFLFPPGEGGAESYLGNIAKELSDTCLVLFNNVHLSNPKRSFQSIGEFYLDHMMKLQQSGPFNLLGWSFGGVLAVEIAIQLLKLGRKVSSIFIIDSYFDVGHASREIGMSGIENILDPINYYYQPSTGELQHLSETCLNIVLFKAGNINDVSRSEELRVLFSYYHKSMFNCLDRLIPESKIKLQILENCTHHSWVHNRHLVFKMCKFIGACLQDSGPQQNKVDKIFTSNRLNMTLGQPMAPLFGVKNTHKQINSGSNGTTPLSVIQWAQRKQQELNTDPNKFFREQLIPEWKKVARNLAEYLGSNPEDIALINNTRFGLNSVIRSILTPRDNVLCMNTVYPMIKSILQHTNAQITEVDVDFTVPITKQIETHLKIGGPFSLCIISHITSLPALLYPVEEVIQLCHSCNVKVLVDGAHAPGQIPLNLNKLRADFYAGSCHKWLYCCRGSGFLWVKKEHQAKISPAVIGMDHNLYPSFPNTFIFPGVQDYSNILSIDRALEFRKEIGEERILDYMHCLAHSAGRRLAEMWKTDVLESDSSRTGFTNVRVPLKDASKLGFHLMQRGFGFIPTVCVKNQWYARFSAQIFNTLQDYEATGMEVLKIADELKTRNL